MSRYICLTTVKAPANYKPRTSSYTLAAYTGKRSAGFRIGVEKEALAHVKKCLTEQNPGVDFKYTVFSEVREIFGMLEYKGGNKEAVK